MSRLALTTILLTAVGLFGCKSDDGGGPTSQPAAHVMTADIVAIGAFADDTATVDRDKPPMVVNEDIDSVWTYLEKKYDTNKDGAIDEAEYTRKDGRFDRLDRNDDGVISDDDFEQQRGGGRGIGGMNAMRGQRVLAGYFQTDDDHAKLTPEELADAAAIYDLNKDGAVDQEEFTCAADARKVMTPGDHSPMIRRLMRESSPWETLISVIDKDNSNTLTTEELMAFFTDQDDGDGVWTIRSPGGGGGDARGPRGGRGGDRPMSGPEEGTVAPDFTLRTLNGDETITLSAFRKNTPVALIFGSYT